MKDPARTALASVALVLCMTTSAFATQKELARTARFPATDDKRVIVDVTSINVTLRSADVREVEVTTDLRISGVGEERAERWISERTPEFVDGPDALTVTARPGPRGFLGLGLLTARARLGVVLPSATIPDITTTSGSIGIHGDFPRAEPLHLRTATGDIEMTGAAAAIDIRSASGDSRIELIRPLQRLFARTSSGSVTLSGGARSVHVDTASGDVWLDNLSGPVEVETSTGKITLRWDRLDAGDMVRVRSTSSRVNILLPAGARPQGTLITTAGTIRSDAPGTVTEAGDTVILSGDGPTLNVESASGEIIVELRD